MKPEQIKEEAERRYPENISVEGKDSNRKQRKNQRIFIEGAEWAIKNISIESEKTKTNINS